MEIDVQFWLGFDFVALFLAAPFILFAIPVGIGVALAPTAFQRN